MIRQPAVRWTIATALIAVAAVLAVVAVQVTRHGSDSGDDITTSTDGHGTDGGWNGFVIDPAQPRPDFTLTETSGRPYDFGRRTEGRLTLLYFGYTHCPDACPLQMATVSSALGDIDVPRPLVVFVTTDPHRDTPQHLREWLDEFGTDFVGLTGTPDQIHQAERAAGVEQSIATDLDGNPTATTTGDYAVGHAAQVIAYTSDDLAHIVYPGGVRRAGWAADLTRLSGGWPGDDGRSASSADSLEE